MKGGWVEPDVRDQVVDFVNDWSAKAEVPQGQLLQLVGVGRGKFANWRDRYGKVNEHNAWIPRDAWLTDAEVDAILGFRAAHPLDGYRRLTYMMIDANAVAASPATVYRVLRRAGCLSRWRPGEPSRKGRGFHQPRGPHEHWHIDVTHINAGGTFYYLCTVLDGYSRFAVAWDLKPHMTEADIELILQRARELHPMAKPRIISDNGPQFIARDFHQFIRISGMTHVRTSPYYPQSNGKLERWHRSLKVESVRPHCPVDEADARQVIGSYIENYNHQRLHSALGYITPADFLAGRAPAIRAARDRRLEAARQARAPARQPVSVPTIDKEVCHV
jgi:transposase InsO family protein